MNKITVLKGIKGGANVVDPVSASTVSPFQIGQARVKSMNALKTLEFYSEAIADPEFQSFLRSKMGEICGKLKLAA